MSINFKKIEMTLAAGEKRAVTTGGNILRCRTLTGAEEIKVKFDDMAFVPFAIGDGYKITHGRVEFHNDNSSQVTIICFQSDEEIYDDRRELGAVTYNLNGELTAAGAPLSDHGGTVTKVGDSSIFYSFTNSTGSTYPHEFITAAENLNGVWIKSIMWSHTQGAAADYWSKTSDFQIANRTLFRHTGFHGDGNATKNIEKEYFAPAGANVKAVIYNGVGLQTYLSFDFV